MTASRRKPRVPAPPAALPADARALWKRLAPGLRASGRLRDEQLPAFELLCTHFALARAAAKKIATDGPTAKDERGLPRKHPAHQVMREHSEAFRQFTDRFGLTPKSRAAAAAKTAPKALAALLLGGAEGVDDDD